MTYYRIACWPLAYLMTAQIFFSMKIIQTLAIRGCCVVHIFREIIDMCGK